MKGITTQEYALKNYLDKHGIHKGNSDMQTIVINSFYNEHNASKGRNAVNENDWKDKLEYIQKHFGLFAMYAHNNWKS